MTGLLLGFLAWVLAGPGAAWVAHWRFLTRVPRAAIVLWQAGASAALVSVIGAGVLIVGSVTDLPGAQRAWPGVVPVVVLSAAVAAFTVLVVIRLVWSLVSVARATGARRRRHRTLVDLLALDRPGAPELRVLAETVPLAYCLPGLRGSRVVVSEGMLSALDPDEVEAVLEHERAHVRARHDLVLDTFTALHRAFPLFVRSELPYQRCRVLVEMLADDAACRRVGVVPLARALVALAAAPVPQDALGVGGETAERVDRLRLGPGPRWLAAAVGLLAAALVALPILILALLT